VQQPTAALPTPQEQPQIMQDLQQNVDFNGFDTAEPVHAEHQELHIEEVPQNAVYQTEQGEVTAKDMKMIQQMIQFTMDNKSWKNTKDSFEERYSGATLEYALEQLMNAQMDSTTEQSQ
jgi:hypothetical protein